MVRTFFDPDTYINSFSSHRFLNSYDKETGRLFRKLEYVQTLTEGLGNVTNAYFLFPYAFIGSRAQLEYLVQVSNSQLFESMI